MALIKSISGIRGTIGGREGAGLSPMDVVRYASSYAAWIREQQPTANNLIVVGRDGRISGPVVRDLVVATLQSMGCNVLDLGLSTTPTVEMAVKGEQAAGGIIITASHNPREWNALKLLNNEGEFLSAEAGDWILNHAAQGQVSFADVKNLGGLRYSSAWMQQHIDAILAMPLVDAAAIRSKKFVIAVDPVNSTGALFVPALLEALGVAEVILINEEVNGQFAHNPEPLPEHLRELASTVEKKNAHLGIAVDPDVDRLCFVCEDGSMFGEEYTLVAIADYVLQSNPGNTVSNMSSTRALRDVTEKHGGSYYPSPVGEVNVVKRMKEVQAVVGGEGNGGVIVPELHYGRDALAGIALFLTHLAKSGKGCKALRNTYPDYFISKNKIDLQEGMDVRALLGQIQEKYQKQPINTEDGLKIEFDKDWVHLRTSNTEPIVRIYAESSSETTANNIARRLMEDLRECMFGIKA